MRIEQATELAVVGPEIVPPFADAMRLVDGDQRQRRAIEETVKLLAGRALGSDVKQIELARIETPDRGVAVGVGGG